MGGGPSALVKYQGVTRSIAFGFNELTCYLIDREIRNA